MQHAWGRRGMRMGFAGGKARRKYTTRKTWAQEWRILVNTVMNLRVP
jgi:hypothetical protein